MTRKTIWIALAVVAIATAGYLLAVLFIPRDSDELPPPAVIVDKTITLKPLMPETSPHATDEVWHAFGRAGLPLTRFRLDQGVTVNPSGGMLPTVILNPRRGRFVVYLYPTEEDALKLVTTAPAVDPVRGLRRTMLRDANVVVIVEPPRSKLERRIRQILETL